MYGTVWYGVVCMYVYIHIYIYIYVIWAIYAVLLNHVQWRDAHSNWDIQAVTFAIECYRMANKKQGYYKQQDTCAQRCTRTDIHTYM